MVQKWDPVRRHLGTFMIFLGTLRTLGQIKLAETTISFQLFLLKQNFQTGVKLKFHGNVLSKLETGYYLISEAATAGVL